jgi:hypothetical protein
VGRGAWVGDLVVSLELAAQGHAQPSLSALSLLISSYLLLGTVTTTLSESPLTLSNALLWSRL